MNCSRVLLNSRPEPATPQLPAPTHRFHLFTMSTFKPHPLAALPTLDFPPFMQAIMQTRQLLQVMDDVLVILVSRSATHWVLAGLGVGAGVNIGQGNEEELVCWNWKTGKVLAVSRCRLPGLSLSIERLALPENGWYASFALLSPTTFMITSTSNISHPLPAEPRTLASAFPPVIQIYSFLPDPSKPVNPLQPLDSDYVDDTTPRPVLLVQLEMPVFADYAIISSFDVRPDPAFPTRRPPQVDRATSIGLNKSFTQNPKTGVVVFELQVLEPHEDGPPEAMTSRHYEMFVKRETLLEMAVEGEKRLVDARDRGDAYINNRVEVRLPWHKWGIPA